MFLTYNSMMHFVYQIIEAYLLFYVFFVFINWKYFKFAAKENGFFIPFLPLFGTTYIVLLLMGRNAFAFIKGMKNLVGLPFTVWIGHNFTYITDDGKEINTILNHQDCLEKTHIYRKFEVVFNRTLLTATADTWKPLRRHFSKSFKPTVLKSFTPIFYQQSCLLLEKLEHLSPSEDVFNLFSKLAFTNFFLTGIGLDESLISSDITRFAQLGDELQKTAADWMLDPIIPVKLALLLLPVGRRIQKLIEDIKRVTENLTEMKKQDRRDNIEYIDNNKQLSLLDHMISVKEQNFNGYEVYADLTLFAGASADTTGHALAFCCILLGMHPEVQEALYDEVVNVLGQNEITNEHMKDLKYTEAVICESMRLFPPIPVVGRAASSSLDIGTKIIPEGTELYLSIHYLHRNPRYWSEPLKFDPTRFLPENASKLKPNSYLPFAGGPRNCIGKEQAMMTLRITLANVVRSFKITTKHKSIDEFRLMSTISMRTVDLLDCTFQLRSK